MGAGTLEAEGEDYIVTITYDETAGIPEVAGIRVEEVTDDHDLYDSYVEQAAETIDADAGSLSYVKLLDICVLDRNGKEVELKGAVDVQISLKDVRKAEESTQIVHFAGEEEVPEVIEPDIEDNTVAFETEGFSIYAIISDDEDPDYDPDHQRLVVRFYVSAYDPETAQNPWKTMYVKGADVPPAEGTQAEIEAAQERFNDILYDPGVPTLPSENIEFLGWIVVGSEGNLMTIDEIRESVKSILAHGVTDGAEVSYYPVFSDTFRIYYENENGAVFHTAFFTSAQGTVDQTYEPSAGASAFQGWVIKGQNPADSGVTTYSQGDTITLTSDVTLVPVIRSGHWIIFKENDGGTGQGNATFTPPHYYYDGDHPVQPADPTRPGYDFDGWWTQAEGGEQYVWNPEGVLTEDITLYAHWTPRTDTQYTVVIWIQDINYLYNENNPNPDPNKPYSFEVAISKTGTTETEIDAAFIASLRNDPAVTAYTVASDLKTGTNGSHGYEYNKCTIRDGHNKAVTIIKGTGDTVINLYYDRALMTATFPADIHFKDHSGNNDNGKVYGKEEFLWWGSGSYFRIKKIKKNWFRVDNGESYNDIFYGRYELVVDNYEVFKGYYGQAFSLYNYQWPQAQNAALYYKNVTFVDAFTGNLYENNALTTEYLSPSNTVIHFWKENLDGTYERVSSQYYVNAGSRFNLTDRFQGLDVAYWKWEAVTSSNQSIVMPSINDPDCKPISEAYYNSALGSNFTGDTRPSADFVYLHIINTREKHSLHFNYKDENGVVQTARSITNIPFEKSLAGYADQIPSNAEMQQYVPEGYYFEEDGWYLDEYFTTKADLTEMTMGVADIPLFAKILPYDIHVRVFKNGGVNEHLAEDFWVSHGEKLSETMFVSLTEKEGYSLVGWYKDADFTESERWSFDAPITLDDLSYTYDGPSDPMRAGYPAGNSYPQGSSDVNYPATVGVITLYAKWHDEAGGYVIRYVKAGEGGSVLQTYDDTHRYTEGSHAVAADFDATGLSCDADMRFDSWSLKGESCRPGDQIQVEEALANAQTEIVEGRTVHVITLTAVYVPLEDGTPTHIYWFNNYEGLTGEAIYFRKDEQLGINESVTVPGWNDDTGIPVRAGYKFLGWAKEDEDPSGLLPDPDPGLFITYDETDKTYDICEVAADEVEPYHAFYAVWLKEITFYVHHSAAPEGTQLEEVPWTEKTPYDLTGNVTDGYLYGGYILNDSDSLATAVPGTRVVPSDGDHLYLREVSNQYLKPQIYITYYANYADHWITHTYGLVNVDNGAYYKSVGLTLFTETSEEGRDIPMEEVYGAIHLLTKDSQDQTLAVKNISMDTLFGTFFKEKSGSAPPCYSGLVDLEMGFDKETGETTAQGLIELYSYYVTKDNVRVPGIKERMTDFGDGQFHGAWGKDGGIRSGTLDNASAKPFEAKRAVASAPSQGAEPASASGVRTVSSYSILAPSESRQYTVTKVMNGQSENQTVEEGDRTGQITYADRPGYMFAGWYLDQAFKTPADFSDISADMTVYAKYISESDVTVSFVRTSNLIGRVPFDVTVSVKASALPDQIEISCVKGEDTVCEALTKTTRVNIGTRKKPVYVYKHQGGVRIPNMGLSEDFTAQVVWTTPDGTTVRGVTYSLAYRTGTVTVQ